MHLEAAQVARGCARGGLLRVHLLEPFACDGLEAVLGGGGLRGLAGGGWILSTGEHCACLIACRAGLGEANGWIGSHAQKALFAGVGIAESPELRAIRRYLEEQAGGVVMLCGFAGGLEVAQCGGGERHSGLHGCRCGRWVPVLDENAGLPRNLPQHIPRCKAACCDA